MYFRQIREVVKIQNRENLGTFTNLNLPAQPNLYNVPRTCDHQPQTWNHQHRALDHQSRTEFRSSSTDLSLVII